MPKEDIVFWACVYKCICHITSAPDHLVQQARDWLHSHGMSARKVNREAFYVELGVAEYDPKEEKLVSWKVLTAYEPIEMDIYYEPHLFRKTVMEIRW